MKILFRLVILISFIILLSSCSPTPFFYHSTANLPYSYRSNKTAFELMKEKNAYFKFGVISAIDDNKLSYVVLAPSSKDKRVQDLVDVNLTNSVPLQIEQAKKFIEILNSSSDNWNTKYEALKGVSYEFYIAPENLIIQQSENVETWYPTFQYFFQNNEDGSVATIFFGEGKLKYFYKLEELSEIKSFANLLNKAVNNR